MSPQARTRFAAFLIAILTVAAWPSPVRAAPQPGGFWYPPDPAVATITRLAATDAVVHMRLATITGNGARSWSTDLGLWFGVTLTPDNRELAARILDLSRTALAEGKTVRVLVDTFEPTTQWAEISGIEVYQ